jgi:uncharacterized OB-fold protein
MTDNGLQLAAQSAAVPHASPGLLTAPFWKGCAEHRLLFQRCGTCSTAGFPPTEQCRQCLSTELSWEASAGRGVVYSWTVVHRAATPVFQTPYAPAIVTLDEGYQMLTNIIDADIEEVRVGMVVRVDFREVVDDLVLPYFQPVR